VVSAFMPSSTPPMAIASVAVDVSPETIVG
jgi:hypothetical protein